MKDAMKRLVLVVMIFVGFQAAAQLEINRGSYVHKKTVRIEGTNSELFDITKNWVTENFDINNDEISFKEGINSIIEIHGRWSHELGGSSNIINFTYTIEILGGVYRESFKEMSYEDEGIIIPFVSKKLPRKKVVIADANAKIVQLSNQLKQFIEVDMVSENAILASSGE